jgi:hypothetical protein
VHQRIEADITAAIISLPQQNAFPEEGNNAAPAQLPKARRRKFNG